MKGLTNKREISVSTQTGRMILSVTEDEQVCVNMGEPDFEPQTVPFRAAKAEKPIFTRRRAYGAVWRGVDGQPPLCDAGR